MTAHLHDVTDDAALATPGSYESEINCARVIADYLSQMPLEAMSRRASELVLLHAGSARLRRDREIVELLAATKRQLVKIRARCGE